MAVATQQVERKKITLTCERDGKPVQVEIAARVCGGLAIHKSIRGKGYTLTHLASSLAIASGLSLPVAEQEKAIADIAQLLDWGRSWDEIVSDWVHDEELKERWLGKVRRLHER